MMGEKERTSSLSDEDIKGHTKGLAGGARGYKFQDIIGGSLILSVLFENSSAVTIEWSTDNDDKFDDIILERGDEITCIQAKNGPGHRLSEADLTSQHRGLKLDELRDSAESRIESGYGSRFVVLTSYEKEHASNIEFSDETKSFTLFDNIEFSSNELTDDWGRISEDTTVEFVLGVPGIGKKPEDEVYEPEKNDVFDRVVDRVATKLDSLENPEIDDAYLLTMKAVDLARQARYQDHMYRLNKSKIVRLLELFPEPQLPQEFPIKEGYIQPKWVEKLKDICSEGSENRILLEGEPGSGKSVGIELFRQEWENSKNQRILQFYLYIPEDADSLEKKRGDPEWFRHQLAAQIYNRFPEAFENSSSIPLWTGVNDLQNYINSLSEWARKNNQRILIVVDGLDHALRYFGETEAERSVEGTILEDIGNLQFPEPLGLLMISRPKPLSDETHDVLNVDHQINIGSWDTDEIQTYLKENEIFVEDSPVNELREVSGGFPVILSHLLSKAKDNDDVLEGLNSALEEASHVDGELEEYYETIWSPLRPYERDAVALVALNPTGLAKDTINSVVDLPHIKESTRLEEPPLSHILDSLSDDRFRIFHDSFRAFARDKLDEDEVRKGHARLHEYLQDQSSQFPRNLENLRYHAEQGSNTSDIKNLATLDNVLHWWAEGAHIGLITDTLDLAFDISLREGDYFSAIDCAILGGVSREMLGTHLGDNYRLDYYAKQDDSERGLRLVNQLRDYAGGSKEELEGMRVIAQNWEEEIDKERIINWFERYQKADQPSWNSEAYFETAAILFDADEFWRAASDLVDEETGKHFPREVLSAVSKHPELLENQPTPPEWLFEDEKKALEACEYLIQDLPEAWRDNLRENSPDYSSLSLPALYILVKCEVSVESVQDIVSDCELEEPGSISSRDGPQFSDAYYAGSILAELGYSGEELLDELEELTDEQVVVRKIIGMVGAATTRENEDETQEWVDATLGLIEKVLTGDQHLARDRFDNIRYRHALSDALSSFDEVIGQGSEDTVRRVLQLAEESTFDDIILNNLSASLSRTRSDLFPGSVSEDELDRRFKNILESPPEELPPSEELMSLSISVIEAGYNKKAEDYYRAAIERCFRYGNHKNMFLDDVWECLEEVAESNWHNHLGTAIRLINWANLLGEITDGDETHHFEGNFLRTLLDEGVIEYDVAEKQTEDTMTQKKLWDWRLENPVGITKDELESLIMIKETKIRRRQYSHAELPFFAKAVAIADDFGWDELVTKGLSVINRADYVRDGIDPDLQKRLELLASKHDIEIPDDLDPDDDSTDYQGEDRSEESKHEEIHDLLSQHSGDDPLTQEDFAELDTEDISVAGELLQRTGIGTSRYDSTIAGPIAKVLASRGELEEATLLIETLIAERNLISWQYGEWGSHFEIIAEVLLEINEEEALQTILNSWRKSRYGTDSYQTILPQLMWVVKRTEGQVAAEEFLSHIIDWTRRLMWPYENRVQKWGCLRTPYS